MKDGTLKKSKLARKKVIIIGGPLWEAFLQGQTHGFRQGYDRGFRNGAVATARSIRKLISRL